MSSGDLERLAASYLCDKDDPTRLSWRELNDSWGPQYPCSNFMISYGLKPWNPEDREEALTISRSLKEGQQDLLPTVGSWIKWNTSGEGREFKCEVLGYETVDGQKIGFLANTFKTTQEKSAHVRYEDGTEDSLDEECLQNRYNWEYCEAPDEEQRRKAKYEQLNRDIGQRSCANCGCSNKKLLICTGCHKEYYCDATCQTENWSTHKETCERLKTVFKPNPRYPLTQISRQMKTKQAQLQTKYNQILLDALAGNFTVQHRGSGPRIRKPRSGTDLETGEKYRLVINNKEDFELKWRGLESSVHSIPENQPMACTTFEYMEMTLSDERYIQGGLHYLAGSGEDETFWYMVINFNTFGTVAPFHGPCHCNPNNVKGQMASERRKLKKKWDRMFKRAKADIKDVQCMFSDTPIGCHNYKDCPYKHNVEVSRRSH